jgi:hypothetical protein
MRAISILDEIIHIQEDQNIMYYISQAYLSKAKIVSQDQKQSNEALNVITTFINRYCKEDSLKEILFEGYIFKLDILIQELMLQEGLNTLEELMQTLGRKLSSLELSLVSSYYNSLGVHFAEINDNHYSALALIKSYQIDKSIPGVNLAYLLRRGEIPDGIVVPDFDTLLKEHLENKESFALVNKALKIVRESPTDESWLYADNLFSEISESENIMKWWYQLTKSNSGEGHLVVGWLCKLDMMVDPDGLTPVDRFIYARNEGWVIPDWFVGNDYP